MVPTGHDTLQILAYDSVGGAVDNGCQSRVVDCGLAALLDIEQEKVQQGGQQGREADDGLGGDRRVGQVELA
ncbi:hypothetical protein D3C86_2031430 [compost metagenome]